MTTISNWSDLPERWALSEGMLNPAKNGQKIYEKGEGMSTKEEGWWWAK
jgi:hypothetical protein